MRTFVLALGLLCATTGAFAADVYVPGHYRDGKWVDGYWRSSPNSTDEDNFSSRGNTNPYTGRPGSTIPDYTRSEERDPFVLRKPKNDESSSSYNPYATRKNESCSNSNTGFGTLNPAPYDPYKKRCN